MDDTAARVAGRLAASFQVGITIETLGDTNRSFAFKGQAAARIGKHQPMKYRNLGKTGLSISTLGFGASPLGNEFGEADGGECIRAVHRAIDCGINFFDTAPYYGRTLSEQRLGEALSGRRDQVVLATKCGRRDLRSFDFSAQEVHSSIDASLGRLRTDHVDLLQAHDIEFADLDQVMNETIPAMLDVQRQGKARFIGVTGYQLGALRKVAEATEIDTVLSYCRYNLMITDMDDLLTPPIEQRGMGLINASPLLMGILTDEGPPAWHPGSASLKRAGIDIAEWCRSQGINPADLALQFALEHPYAATTLVGMSTVQELERNVRAAEIPAHAAVMAQVIQEIRVHLSRIGNVTWHMGRPENEDYAEDSTN
jgi:L-galactose dehydrogenase